LTQLSGCHIIATRQLLNDGGSRAGIEAIAERVFVALADPSRGAILAG
jgi:hypothetical protein